MCNSQQRMEQKRDGSLGSHFHHQLPQKILYVFNSKCYWLSLLDAFWSGVWSAASLFFFLACLLHWMWINQKESQTCLLAMGKKGLNCPFLAGLPLFKNLLTHANFGIKMVIHSQSQTLYRTSGMEGKRFYHNVNMHECLEKALHSVFPTTLSTLCIF